MRTPTAVVIGATLFSLGCAHVFRQSHDYVFGVAVIVRDGQDVPIPGARVSLTLAEPVFQAVTPVSAAEKLTDEMGGCVFMYIAGRHSVPYSLTVRKDGYGSRVVSGVASPQAYVRVQLRPDAIPSGSLR